MHQLTPFDGLTMVAGYYSQSACACSGCIPGTLVGVNGTNGIYMWIAGHSMCMIWSMEACKG